MRIITFSLILSLFIYGLAQDCNNPLLSKYGFQGLDEPESGAGLPYCSALQGGNTCCSSNVVSGFQNRVDGLVERLDTYNTARDLYITALKDQFLDRFEDLVENLRDYSDDIDEIRQNNSTFADELEADRAEFRNISSELSGIYSNFSGALRDYQRARLQCLTAGLQAQASSWCLACDPEYASKGVLDDGTISFSDNLCQAISDACSPFLETSAAFNPLIRAREVFWRLQNISWYLSDFSDSDDDHNRTVEGDNFNPIVAQEAFALPEGWTENRCPWELPNQFPGNLLFKTLAVNTASQEPADGEPTEEVVVVEEIVVVEEVVVTEVVASEPAGRRFLQEVDVPVENEVVEVIIEETVVEESSTNAWDPALDETGLTFNIREDPGDVFWLFDLTDHTDTDHDQQIVDHTDGDGEVTDHDLTDNRD